MKINSISITRRADYEKRGDDKSDFKASIRVDGDQHASTPTITICLEEEQLEPIVAIIAQCVAHNMTEAARQFHEEVQASLAGPVVEQLQTLDELDIDDDVPF